MKAEAVFAAMASLPVAEAATILGGQAPLVLSPHPDDESLGCGGLLAMYAERAAVVMVTDGSMSHPNSARFPGPVLASMREAEARDAVATLGLPPERIEFLGLPDSAAPFDGPAFEAAVDRIVAALDRFGCGVLLAPWRHDPHGDHKATDAMARDAAARAGVTHLAYPIWGWTLDGETELGEAPSGWRLDVSAQLDRKRRAIDCHRTQYAGVIDDDPDGFQLPQDFRERFERRFETYLRG